MSIPSARIFFGVPIDKAIQRMLFLSQMSEMNGIQAKLDKLHNKGWTWAAIADEFGITPNAVEKWRAGDRNARLEKTVLEKLDQLLARKCIPKKRRYAKGSRRQEVSNGQ